MLGKRHDVSRSLAQRRQMDRHHVEPIEQILAELPLADRGGEVAMGRGEEPRVDPNRPAADRSDAALLDRSQDLRLHRRIHVADLVEKQRSTIRIAERAAALRDRTGESASHMAE